MEKLNLKVGDKVLLTNSHFSRTVQRITTVTKVTPKGNYRVEHSSYLFDCYGYAKGAGTWEGHSSIEPLTDELLQEFNNKCKLQKCKSLLKKVVSGEVDITLEQAVAIMDILAEKSK